MLSLTIDGKQKARAENFFEIYELEHCIGDLGEKIILGDREKRKCRFCKRTNEQVSFSKDAHVLPQFMGNRGLLSYFECNECNERFSEYEDSFAKFVGAARTISQIKGKAKTKVPKFKDSKTRLEISLGDKAIHVGVEHDSEEVVIDKEAKQLIIKTKRPTYVPIHVFKVLAKIGLSMLREEELEEYEKLRILLETSDYDKKLDGNQLIRMIGHLIPGPPFYKTPYAHLYNKKAEYSSNSAPQKTLIVFYANYMYQIVMPFGEKDKHLMGRKMTMPLFPILIDIAFFARYGDYKQFNLDLSSCDKKKDESHELYFSFESIETQNEGKNHP